MVGQRLGTDCPDLTPKTMSVRDQLAVRMDLPLHLTNSMVLWYNYTAKEGTGRSSGLGEF